MLIWHFSSCRIGQSPSQRSSQTSITRIEEEPFRYSATTLAQTIVALGDVDLGGADGASARLSDAQLEPSERGNHSP
jgi:hypothetical protein